MLPFEQRLDSLFIKDKYHMNFYLFSENIFLYKGMEVIFKEDHGLALRHITIDLLMHYCNSDAIKEDDIFLVSTDSFNLTMSILVMLDQFSSNIILLSCDSNAQKIANHFSLLPCNKVDVDSITEIVRGDIPTLPPKMWRLTYKEASVLSYRLQGLSIYNVNYLLSLSAKTVYSYQRHALIKIGVKTIAHLHRLSKISPARSRLKVL